MAAAVFFGDGGGVLVVVVLVLVMRLLLSTLLLFVVVCSCWLCLLWLWIVLLFLWLLSVYGARARCWWCSLGVGVGVPAAAVVVALVMVMAPVLIVVHAVVVVVVVVVVVAVVIVVLVVVAVAHALFLLLLQQTPIDPNNKVHACMLLAASDSDELRLCDFNGFDHLRSKVHIIRTLDLLFSRLFWRIVFRSNFTGSKSWLCAATGAARFGRRRDARSSGVVHAAVRGGCWSWRMARCFWFVSTLKLILFEHESIAFAVVFVVDHLLWCDEISNPRALVGASFAAFWSRS